MICLYSTSRPVCTVCRTCIHLNHTSYMICVCTMCCSYPTFIYDVSSCNYDIFQYCICCLIYYLYNSGLGVYSLEPDLHKHNASHTYFTSGKIIPNPKHLPSLYTFPWCIYMLHVYSHLYNQGVGSLFPLTRPTQSQRVSYATAQCIFHFWEDNSQLKPSAFIHVNPYILRTFFFLYDFWDWVKMYSPKPCYTYSQRVQRVLYSLIYFGNIFFIQTPYFGNIFSNQTLYFVQPLQVFRISFLELGSLPKQLALCIFTMFPELWFVLWVVLYSVTS